MPALNINGTSIDFPHTPYDCQLEYIQRLLGALQQAEHAILESPTGTGKTLCLLCTSLAWLTSVNNNQGGILPSSKNDLLTGLNSSPRVIFASRTHSQLTQAVNVLKRTAYSNRNVSVIGSRDQLCLLSDITSLESNSAKIFACRTRIQTKTCEYYRNFDLRRDSLLNTLKAERVVDIEDLVKFGKSTGCCPYLMSRELKSDADIIFTPYNYLLDPKIRRLYNFNLENAAVIFDEAHNIEQVCEEVASITLSSTVLASAIEYVRVVCEVVFSLTIMSDDGTLSHTSDNMKNVASFDISRAGEDKMSDLNLERLLTLKSQLIDLERHIDALDVADSGLAETSEFVFDLLNRAGITVQTKECAIQTIEEILSVASATENSKLRKSKGITEVLEFIKTVFDSKQQAQSMLYVFDGPVTSDHSRCYRAFIKDELIIRRGLSGRRTLDEMCDSVCEQNQPPTNRTLSYWCLSPGCAMQDLLKERVRCVILTSGTLYPIAPLQLELRMNFPVLLQNSHVITSEQLFVAVITHGKDGEPLNSSYTSRDKPGYQESLGLTLIDLAKIVPNGLLVFFPSYAMLHLCVDVWRNGHIYGRLLQHKRIFVEPRDRMQFTTVFADYCEMAKTSNGAVLFAVMRGRASEGLDLADFAGRGVVVLGVPYPPILDPRVRLKMAYMDEQQMIELNPQDQSNVHSKVKPCFLTGRKWYNQQAWRAVNQSVGRVIRHHRDFGAVFLCDERFARWNARMQLPQWMQPSVRVYSDLNASVRETLAFYKEATSKYTPRDVGHTEPNRFSDSIRLRTLKRPLIASTIFPTTQGAAAMPYNTVRAANEVNVFAHSLAPDSLIYSYSNPVHGSCDTTTRLPQSSVFTSIDNRTNPDLLTVTPTNEASIVNDTSLETRLLCLQPIKRLKLSRESVSTAEQGFTNPSNYIKNVEAHLYDPNCICEDKSRLQFFKEAVHSYDAHKTSSSTHNADNVHECCVKTLYNKLSQIFNSPSTRHLLTGGICLLDPLHRPQFRKLCTQLVPDTTTSQFTDQSIVPAIGCNIKHAVVCSKCHAHPARVPLVSSCRHVACFGCWRSIIEEGNRHCPVCQVLVRRRNLTRLVSTISIISSPSL